MADYGVKVGPLRKSPKAPITAVTICLAAEAR
jgi:hypothetical protein